MFCVLRDLGRKLADQPGADFARDIQRELVEKKNVGFALLLGESDRDYFAATIQTDPPKQLSPSLRSHLNIQKARTYLYQSIDRNIEKLPKAEALAFLKELRQIVRSDLVMACIPVQMERDAFKIFETLNDRGLRLSVPDLLLNYLMGEAHDKDHISIRASWDDMLESMGQRDINRFLRHWWVSKYGDLKREDLFSALKKRIKDDKSTSLDFVQGCAEECDRYIELVIQDKDALKDAADLVTSLVRKLEVQSALPVLLSATICVPDLLAQIARLLLVFVVRYSVIGNHHTSQLESIFFALARSIRELRFKNKPPKEIINHIKTTLVNASPDEKQFTASLPNLILSPEEARYIVPTLARHMQSKTKELTINEANIEHIFPKRPSSEWGAKEQSELTPLLWHLGNLTILGARLNRTAENSKYTTKKAHYESKSELEMPRRVAKEFKT